MHKHRDDNAEQEKRHEKILKTNQIIANKHNTLFLR